MLKRMTLYISTGDGVVGMALYISTGDGVVQYPALEISTGDGPVEYGAVDLYWGRCGRVCRCRFLLGTLW